MSWRLLLLVVCAGCSSTSVSTPQIPTVEGASYVGDQVCQICHAAQTKKMEQTVHGRMADFETPIENRGCESCHGAGSRHVQARGDRDLALRFGAPADTSVKKADKWIVGYRNLPPSGRQKTANHCLTCHTKETHFFWSGSYHAPPNATCVDCHNPMEPTRKILKKQEPNLCVSCHVERRGQARYPSHHPIEEGRMRCSDCHNSHGSSTRSMLRADTVNELCQSCHAEKEGPFVFEHAPVTESCTTCHEPHGTVANNLLRESDPFLCLGCHTGHQSAIVSLQDVVLDERKRSTFYTGCVQCHQSVHGTDLPSTSGHGRFTR